MIISHKHKYIFIKPIKVAGTSIEIALAKHCGDKDVVTPISKYNPESDNFKYDQPAKNFEKQGFFNHITPAEIKEKVSEEVWNEYYKFSVVRNPFDQVVSHFFWKKKSTSPKQKINVKNVIQNIFNSEAYIFIGRKLISKFAFSNLTEFQKFVRLFRKKWTNTRYYFKKDGSPLCDFYLRYEHLDEDYEKVCQELGIPYEELPKTKNKQRVDKKHYSAYYDESTLKNIESLFQKEIAFFKYKFEKN